jgi:predicted TIM-barrel fold metal-dependent hydrolase
MRKIDIHCHTTRSQLQEIMPACATLSTIENEMRIHNIEYTVVLATYFPKSGSGISNYRMLHWIQNKPAFKLFGSLDFQHYFAAGLRELTELAEAGYLNGIKIYSGYQDIDYHSDKFTRIGNLAEQYQLPLMFHGGFQQCHENNIELAVSPQLIAAAAKKFPHLPIIISHLAWPFVQELIEAALEFNNIYTDMSGMLDSYKTPLTLSECVNGLKKYLDACGPKRLLFGTDFPIQTHADSVQLIELSMAEYTDNDRQDVYYNNAANLIKLLK